MKVTIIGASISGLFAAELLARGGVEVEVYDKENELGSPSRTLIVTNKLKEVLDSLPEEAILNRLRFIEVRCRATSTKLQLPFSDLVVERKDLVRLLARQAIEGGAKIILGHRFERLVDIGGKVVATMRNLETGEIANVPSDVLIGADGVSSSVAHAISCDGHHPVPLMQARIRFPNELAADTCQVWFDVDRTKYFFWLIPESKETAVVGLIGDGSGEVREVLDSFIEEKRWVPLEYQRAAVPLHRFEWVSKGPSAGKAKVFLVGDAAGQVKITTVGGVVTGLNGAKALATALLNGGDYRKELRSLEHELNLHLLIRKILNRFRNEDYEELIRMIQGDVKEILQTWTRDDLRRFILKLISAQPRLITLGLKAIL